MYFRKGSVNAQEQEYLKTDGPTLNMLCKTTAIPQSFRLPLDADSCGSGLTIHNAPNTNIRLIFYLVLNLSFHNDDKEQADSILLGLKEALYAAEIPVQFLAEVLHYSHLTVLSRSNLLKKVLAEFLQTLSFPKVENIWGSLHSYPIADLAFIIALRSLLFNRNQDIGLLDFNKNIPTGVLFDSLGSLIGLKHKKNREGEWTVEGKWLVTQQEDAMSVKLISRKESLSSNEAVKESVSSTSMESIYQNSISSEEYSPTKRKIVIEDARNAISEESHPTESDAESEVVYKHEFPRNDEEDFSDLQTQPKFQKPSTVPFKKPQPRTTDQSYPHQESRFQHGTPSSTYEAISPLPLNYDIKNDYFVNAVARNNNLFQGKKKVVRHDEQSNDSKGRRVSLSKERLSAKKKPDISAIGHLEARFPPDELSNDPSGNVYYNGIGSHQQSQQHSAQMQFMYGSPLPGLPPKSNSLQKRAVKMTGSLEQEEKMMKAGRRQQSPYDKSRPIRRNNP